MATITMKLVRNLTLALAGCVMACVAGAQTSQAEQLAVGTWYGEFSAGPGQPIQRFINTRHADGTYTVLSRLYQPGKPSVELRNKGIWGVSNGIYFTITTEVDGQRIDSNHSDAANPYLVQSLTPTNFEYLHIPSGHRFRVVRVDPATVLPN